MLRFFLVILKCIVAQVVSQGLDQETVTTYSMSCPMYDLYQPNKPTNQTGSLCDPPVGYQPLFNPLPPFVMPSDKICASISPESCAQSKYRTADGSCNNLRNPRWGSVFSRLARLLPPKYADGVHAPTLSVTGENLPSARLVSTVLFPDENIPDPGWTLITMQWGQIVSHDLSFAMGTTQTKPHPLNCCSNGKVSYPNDYVHSFCFPIIIPKDDPHFKTTCMEFVRTTTDLDAGCPLPQHPAEQLSTVTNWLDASIVYGSAAEVTTALREFHGGRLIVQYKNGRTLPPLAANQTASCILLTEDDTCYQFGDYRGNQNIQLSLLQVILLREHNRLAGEFERINPHWNDERLFQEARRLLIAQHQFITYYEWLPIFLGSENMRRRGIFYPEAEGYVEDYREEVDPSIINSYTTAAFRFYHSSIQGILQLIEEDRQTNGAVQFNDYFNRPALLELGQFDNLARGFVTQVQQKNDQFLTSQITDYLGELDLRAIDIQRGRDHGLPSYNDFREICGLPRANSFDDFKDFINPEIVEKLKTVYAHHDDVDFIVGGSLEYNLEKTQSGPTNLCIILEQYYRTRVGDRYFFERGRSNPGAFSPEQLHQIRKTSISRIICDNSDNIRKMQPKGFEVISPTNPLVPCFNTNSISAIDLSFWREEIPAQEPINNGRK